MSEGAPADSPFTRARPVLSRVVTASDKEFTRLTTDAGSVTSTEHHLYWATDLREWLRADELKPGNRLLDATGRETAVAATDSFVQEQITYDLDVSGIDSYYVGVGESSALVHNCTDLVKDASRFPGLAHTLDEHVDVDLDRMKELAIEKTRRRGRPTPNSRWTDRQTAQQVVDYAVAGNKARIDKWLREGARQPLELKGTFGAKNSLGDVMTHTGQHSKAGNGYVVLLQRAPGHKPGGYYVSTAYPV
ncbi:RNase A-like domain-containing protein [Streptomyces parvus]|uniref:RNase A-like domain-containing protein n=1 Tax=Streptomyces parvus TaxID=66428 RepID=UPI00363ED513